MTNAERELHDTRASLDRHGLDLELHGHVRVDAEHQHGRRRDVEVPDVEGVLAGDDDRAVSPRIDAEGALELPDDAVEAETRP